VQDRDVVFEDAKILNAQGRKVGTVLIRGRGFLRNANDRERGERRWQNSGRVRTTSKGENRVPIRDLGVNGGGIFDVMHETMG